MRTFHCQACGNAVYFENHTCTVCGHALGWLPDRDTMSALAPLDDGRWRALAANGAIYRQCDNYATHGVCNWMVPAADDAPLCTACRFNRMIPNLARPSNLAAWGRLERGKRRLLYSLRRLGLPLADQWQDPAHGLAFAFLSSLDASPDGNPVSTGHANGLITIDIDEANPALRERTRLDLNEDYRTLIGHFRHEIGHYYWDRLIPDDADRLTAFRELFGDEQADYAAALADHYANGPAADWQGNHISAYASAHPWEDWAETFAHYLHIVDTLETARNFNLEVERRLPDGTLQRSDPEFDAYRIDPFAPLLAHWLPLTFALNSLNRSMGMADPYPFVIAPAVERKLAFIHETVREARAAPAPTLPSSVAADTAAPDAPRRGWLSRLFGGRNG